VFKQDVADVDNATGDMQVSNGFSAQHVYHHALKGFAARLSAKRRRGAAQ